MVFYRREETAWFLGARVYNYWVVFGGLVLFPVALILLKKIKAVAVRDVVAGSAFWFLAMATCVAGGGGLLSSFFVMNLIFIVFVGCYYNENYYSVDAGWLGKINYGGGQFLLVVAGFLVDKYYIVSALEGRSVTVPPASSSASIAVSLEGGYVLIFAVAFGGWVVACACFYVCKYFEWRSKRNFDSFQGGEM